MGQTYAVYLKVQFKDEEGAKKALKDKINRDEDNVSYGVERLQSQHGFDLDNIIDLMSVFFCGFGNRLRQETPDPDLLTTDFDACYAWEGVMQEAFNVMAPFLKDGSYIKIYPDSGKDVGVAMDGKSKWFYTDGPTSL